MGKIKNPDTISSKFGVSDSKLRELGVTNVLLDADTKLFIDPMLLECSRHKEMSDGANRAYLDHFEKVVKLLSKSKEEGDITWRAAKKYFKFPEINWTCLGYGAAGKGSGFGDGLTTQTLKTAHEIIQLGVDDLDMFMALSLFEEGIGADRISDMTTNIIIENLIEFTDNVNKKLKIPTKSFNFRNGAKELIENPFTKNPLIFVPSDIVRDLPVANSWGDISRVIQHNDELRERISSKIGDIWATMSSKEKRRVRENSLKSKESFEELMKLLRSVDAEPYDFEKDRNGEVFWCRLLDLIKEKYPIDLNGYSNRLLDAKEAIEIVDKILFQFRDLVENKGLWKELWDDSGKPRKEKAAQRLFFATAYSYCRANDLDLSPEADSGNGPVDFKLSRGSSFKVAVELKLSTNPQLIHGYEKQLEIYKKAEDADEGYFVIIDLGGLGKKYDNLIRMIHEREKAMKKCSKVLLVDATEKLSASKRN